jgi:hypothetical protein
MTAPLVRRYYIATPKRECDMILFVTWHQAFATILRMDKQIYDEALRRFKESKLTQLKQDDWIFWNGKKLLEEFGYKILPVLRRTDKPEAAGPSETGVDHDEVSAMHESITKSFH